MSQPVGPAPTLTVPDEQWRNAAQLMTLVVQSLAMVKSARNSNEARLHALRAEAGRSVLGMSDGMPRPLDHQEFAAARQGITAQARREIFPPVRRRDGNWSVAGYLHNVQGQAIQIGAMVPTESDAQSVYRYFTDDSTPVEDLMSWTATNEPLIIERNDLNRRTRNDVRALQDVNSAQASGALVELISELNLDERLHGALFAWLNNDARLRQPEVVEALQVKEGQRLVAQQEAAMAEPPVQPYTVNAPASENAAVTPVEAPVAPPDPGGPQTAAGPPQFPAAPGQFDPQNPQHQAWAAEARRWLDAVEQQNTTGASQQTGGSAPWERQLSVDELRALHPREGAWAGQRAWEPIGADGQLLTDPQQVDQRAREDLGNWNPNDPEDCVRAASAYDQVSDDVRAELEDEFPYLAAAMQAQPLHAATSAGNPNAEQQQRVNAARAHGSARQAAMAAAGMSVSPDPAALAAAQANNAGNGGGGQQTTVRPRRGPQQGQNGPAQQRR